MKTFKTIALGLVFCATLLSSCKKDEKTTDLTCQLETQSSTFTEESIEVTYKLEATGDFAVNSFYYYDETGKIELQNPTVPSELKITLSTQKQMQAGAMGSVTNGSIRVSFKAQSATSTYEGVDQCEQQSTN